MMTSSQLWSENDLLREKLKELQKQYETEREFRLKLQAENLWIKKLLKKDFEQSALDRLELKNQKENDVASSVGSGLSSGLEPNWMKSRIV